MCVSRQNRTQGRGGQLSRRRCHRRGVLQPRRELRRRRASRDAGLGRVDGDGHEQPVQWQEAVQRGHIAVGRQLGHDHARDVLHG